MNSCTYLGDLGEIPYEIFCKLKLITAESQKIRLGMAVRIVWARIKLHFAFAIPKDPKSLGEAQYHAIRIPVIQK